MLNDSKNIIAERNFFTIFANITLIVPLLKSAAKIFLISLFLTLPLDAFSQSLRESLRGDVAFLADSLIKGREFGTKENLSAAFHINKSFRETGLWTRFQLYRSDGKTGRNVIGFTPGFYDRYIVIGAHFDGLGFQEGNHYPGADSNASGVAALLALAREIVHLRSHTGVIFVAFDGYNNSLSGSSAFLEELSKSFGERQLFHDLTLLIEGGDRIALIGDNGTGKTTLLKLLMDEEYPDAGKIKFGPAVRTAYLPQIVEFDVPSRNLVDTMLYAKRNVTPQSARDRLAMFHFTGEDVFKSVSVLSGGELSRLKLCMLMDEEINLLILDEPTNHLDIASREWIEEAVESYDGTLLFVSHDRYFINRFATRVWELGNGTITDYPMGFARYRQMKAMYADQIAEKAEKKSKK